MKPRVVAIVAAGLAAQFVGHADAAVVGLYNTGQQSSGGVDTNWTVSGCEDYPTCSVLTGPAAYVISNPGSIGWIGNLSNASWISNVPSTDGGTGPFTYSETFNASSGNKVSVTFAADDEASFYLNGTLVFTGDADGPHSPWSYFETFTLSGFANGTNVLTIVVPNNVESAPNVADGPTGVQAQFTVLNVPETSTWIMMGLGFVGLALTGRLARRSPAVV